MSTPIITLLTDFGNRDGFIGTMKGVILSICPNAKIVDLSHEIDPQNVSAGAFVLANSAGFFPKGTIHVAVVDPGVGSSRRILCSYINEQFYLAPDNGILKYIFAKSQNFQTVEVSNSRYFLHNVSSTFHGRDIFAPVAAHLANGLNFKYLGKEIDDFDRGRLPEFSQQGNEWYGEIVYVDRFGNLISNVPGSDLKKSVQIEIADCHIDGLSTSYSDGKPGEPIAIVGSSGFLEIAINLGNASEQLNCSESKKILVRVDS